MKRIIIFFLVFCVYSCADKPSEKVDSPTELVRVVPVNYPLYYFADRIGGDLIDIAYPVPPGIDPAYWTPDEQALALYQSADLILDNGADYAKWMKNVSLPSSRVLNTSSGVDEKLIRVTQTATHSHGPEGEHEHAESAFTIWLDLEIALQQAHSIKTALVKRIPEKSQELNANFESLKKDLESIHAELSSLAPRFKDQVLIGSHPVYQYLARAYDLNIISVHFEPDEMPSNQQWAELDQLLKQSGTNIMLWEGAPDPGIREELLKRDIQIAVFDPCGNRPETGDFLSVMQRNVDNLRRVE